MSKLNSRQEAFAQHYALHRSPTEAYKAAGYSTKGKPETINRLAFALLENDKIATRISELQERVRDHAESNFGLTVDKLLEAYMDIAFADPADLFEWDEDGDMTLKASKDLTPRQRRLVAHVQKSRGNSTSLEFRVHDRMKALDALAKRIGFFEVDNAQGAGGGVQVVLSPEDASL